MRHFIALSLAVFIPFTVANAAPPTPTCPAKGFAIKEQGVRAPLAPAESGAASDADVASSSEPIAVEMIETVEIAVEKVERGRIAGGTGAAGPTDHAINTKGTGTSSGRASSKLAIKTKGTSAHRQATSEMAINTKGTGAAGRVAPTVVVSAPGPDKDCDG